MRVNELWIGSAPSFPLDSLLLQLIECLKRYQAQMTQEAPLSIVLALDLLLDFVLVQSVFAEPRFLVEPLLQWLLVVVVLVPARNSFH